MPNDELLFGFLGQDGVARRVAKLQVSKESDGRLRNLYIIQSDAAQSIHFSLHYAEMDGKQPKYQMRYEHPESFSEEDRPSGPEIIDLAVPGIDDLYAPWFVQSIPFCVRNDIKAYRPLGASEREKNQAGIANVRDIVFSPHSAGSLEVHLVRPGDTRGLERLRGRVARGLRCWRVHTSVTPWILAYIKIVTVRAGRVHFPPGIDESGVVS